MDHEYMDMIWIPNVAHTILPGYMYRHVFVLQLEHFTNLDHILRSIIRSYPIFSPMG